MKLVTITISIFLTSLVNISAQSNNLIPLDSIVTYNGHSAKLHKETFNNSANKGLVGTVEGLVWNEKDWDQTYTINCAYDSEGNLLSEIKTMKGSPDYIERENIFAYDEHNNFISEEFFLYNYNIQKLVGIGKYTYTYDSNEMITKVVESSWDSFYSEWFESAIYQYQYDANQNQTLLEVQKRTNGSLKWERDSKIERIFSPSNILLEESVFKGSLTEGWSKISKKETELNANNTLKTVTVYKNDGHNQWLNSDQSTYVYDKNKLQTVNSSSWNGSKWVLHSKDDYIYTGEGEYTVTSNFKKNNGLWTSYLEKVVSVNANIKQIEQYSINTKGEKQGLKKTHSQIGGDFTSFENFSWNEGQWISQSKDIVFFDENSQVGSLEKRSNGEEYYKTEFSYMPDSRILSESTFDWFQGNWALGKRVQYFYADTITGIEQLSSTPTIKITTGIDVINIQSEAPLKNVRVFSMTGKLIANGSDSQINTSSWDKTAYIVSVTTRLDERKAVKVLIK